MVVKAGQFRMPQKNKKLRLRVTSAMAPTARIVVYWTRPDGEIIADAVEFNVEGLFDNEVFTVMQYIIVHANSKILNDRMFVFER